MAILSLRGVISALSAMSVAVVAAITLSICLTSSLSALRGIGQTHAGALLANANQLTEALFAKPGAVCEALQNVTKGDVWPYPSDNATVLALIILRAPMVSVRVVPTVEARLPPAAAAC